MRLLYDVDGPILCRRPPFLALKVPPHAFTVSQRALLLPGASGSGGIDFSTH